MKLLVERWRFLALIAFCSIFLTAGIAFAQGAAQPAAQTPGQGAAGGGYGGAARGTNPGPTARGMQPDREHPVLPIGASFPDFNLPGVDGKMHTTSLPAPFSVTGPESYLLATRLGLGLAQMPHFHVVEDIKRGSLVALLTDTPPPSAPVSLMYAQNRQLSPRVRAFSDWLARQFSKSEE